MANMNIDQEWQKVKRASGISRFSPRISIRSNGTIALSSDFVRVADVEFCTRVSLFLSSNGLKLALKFHSDEKDDDAFLLGKDGGSGNNKTKLIVAATLLRQSNIFKALIKESSEARKYEPIKDRDKWIVNLAPCFELILGEKIFPKESTGIYRYRFKDEILYIGKGNIMQRLSSQERKEWEYDKIEYSILNDEMNETKWETYWLNEYRERNGRWPIYNRISGMREVKVG